MGHRALRTDTEFGPANRRLHESGKLAQRVALALSGLRECQLCPRECGVNRLAGEVGDCQIGARARVSSFHVHFGEEAPLTGRQGSGTIFFAGCNLHCRHFQNQEIGRTAGGMEVESQQLAQTMLRLQEAGCHNINPV
jgi:putative pyruvate formate lyase activating enzyme